jgi:CRP/FNR family transcriptional regulator, cyclic AMP receptor protein
LSHELLERQTISPAVDPNTLMRAGSLPRPKTGRPDTSGEHLFERILAAVEAGHVVANERTFERGDIVFHEGDPGDSLHLVRQGMFAIRASTPSGAILIVDILAPGDVFGEFAVFSNQRRRTTEVTALSPGVTLTVEREQLRAAIGFRPELAEELIATIIGKAESTTQRLVEMLHVPAELRVLRALLSMATVEGVSSPVRLTQDELASFAATTRPTANRVLRQEEERGTVELSRGQVMVLDRQRLAARAGVDPK